MDKCVKILIACHKPSPIPKAEALFPVQVGMKGADIQMGIQGDDEGENISDKNYCYCELTALYWAWKNLKDVDVIGLCHYRRYFDFHDQCIRFLPDTSFPVSAIRELDFSLDETTLKKVIGGGVVVPKALFGNCTMEQLYCMGHISEDYKTLRKVFFDTQSDNYKKAFDELMVRGYKFYAYNMMVMRWADFDAYCEWLFSLLFEVEQQVDISRYSAYQKRIFGFMSERLLNVWLFAEKKQCIERPVIFIDENCEQRFPRRCAFRQMMKGINVAWHCRMANWHYRKTL